LADLEVVKTEKHLGSVDTAEVKVWMEYETHESLQRKSSMFTDDEGTGISQNVKMLDFC